MRIALVIAAASAVILARPAFGALTSSAEGYGRIASSADQTTSIAGGFRDLSPPPVILDNFGDEVLAAPTLSASGGSFTMSAHACSGPQVGIPNAGTAQANTVVRYTEEFLISSSTLPIGTPVTVNVKVGGGSSFKAFLIPDDRSPIPVEAATAQGSGSISFSTTGVNGITFNGAFGMQQAYVNPQTKSSSGLFAEPLVPTDGGAGAPDAGTFTGTVAGTVGQRFDVSLLFSIGASSTALNPTEAEADGQISLTWGADVAGGMAEIRSPDDGFLFPGTTGVTTERTLDILPPSPIDELDPNLPEPMTLAAAGVAVAMLGRRRRALR